MSDPTKTFIGFVFVSGRGLDKNSRQCLLLNEFDEKKKFYKDEDIEYLMAFAAKKSKNVYFVGVFSLGRRVFDPMKHSGFLKKEEAAVLRKLWNDSYRKKHGKNLYEQLPE